MTTKIRTAEEHLTLLRRTLATKLAATTPIDDPEIESIRRVILGYVGNGVEAPPDLTPEQTINRVMKSLGIAPERYRTSGYMARRSGGRREKVAIRLSTWDDAAEEAIAEHQQAIRDTTFALGHEYAVRVDYTRSGKPLTYVHHAL